MKKKIASYNTMFIWIIIFFVVNIVIKSINITSTPPSLTYDELYYAAEAQGIMMDSSDASGTWRPWHLAPSNSIYSELTGTTLIPGFLLFPHNPMLAVKSMSILVGSLIPILLALIAYRLSGSKSVTITTLIIGTLNPWMFQLSRMSFDSLYSVFFYTLGILLFLTLKSKQLLWSLLPFTMGFFQYQGHKPLLIPIIVICAAYKWYESKKISIPSISVLIIATALTVSYAIRLPHLSASVRMQEYDLLNQAGMSNRVDYVRRLSFDSPLVPIFTNKYAEAGGQMAERFLRSFDLQALFIRGNNSRDTFAVTSYGFFHLIDAVIIILGIVWFSKTKKYSTPLKFIAGLIIIGTIPNVLKSNDFWIIFRGAFIYLGLIMMIGIMLGANIENKTIRTKIAILGAYCLMSLSFFYIYFAHYPLSATQNEEFYNRILASYIDRQENRKVQIVSDNQQGLFDQIAVYNSLFTKENSQAIRAASRSKKYSINNIHIVTDCPDPSLAQTVTTVINAESESCLKKFDGLPKIEIKSPIDSGTKYVIINDRLCSQYQLKRYPYIKQNVLNVERNSDWDFCLNYFFRQPDNTDISSEE
jgi:uncharacterized membrane protein